MSDDELEEEENLLSDIQCPVCESNLHLQVEVPVWVTISADGTSEVPGDHEWDDDSAMLCVACGCQGKVRDFTTRRVVYPAQLAAMLNTAIDWQIMPDDFAAVVGYSARGEGDSLVIELRWDDFGEKAGLSYSVDIDADTRMWLSADKKTLTVETEDGRLQGFNLVVNTEWILPPLA